MAKTKEMINEEWLPENVKKLKNASKKPAAYTISSKDKSVIDSLDKSRNLLESRSDSKYEIETEEKFDEETPIQVIPSKLLRDTHKQPIFNFEIRENALELRYQIEFDETLNLLPLNVNLRKLQQKLFKYFLVKHYVSSEKLKLIIKFEIIEDKLAEKDDMLLKELNFYRTQYLKDKRLLNIPSHRSDFFFHEAFTQAQYLQRGKSATPYQRLNIKFQTELLLDSLNINSPHWSNHELVRDESFDIKNSVSSQNKICRKRFNDMEYLIYHFGQRFIDEDKKESSSIEERNLEPIYTVTSSNNFVIVTIFQKNLKSNQFKAIYKHKTLLVTFVDFTLKLLPIKLESLDFNINYDQSFVEINGENIAIHLYKTVGASKDPKNFVLKIKDQALREIKKEANANGISYEEPKKKKSKKKKSKKAVEKTNGTAAIPIKKEEVLLTVGMDDTNTAMCKTLGMDIHKDESQVNLNSYILVDQNSGLVETMRNTHTDQTNENEKNCNYINEEVGLLKSENSQKANPVEPLTYERCEYPEFGCNVNSELTKSLYNSCLNENSSSNKSKKRKKNKKCAKNDVEESSIKNLANSKNIVVGDVSFERNNNLNSSEFEHVSPQSTFVPKKIKKVIHQGEVPSLQEDEVVETSNNLVPTESMECGNTDSIVLKENKVKSSSKEFNSKIKCEDSRTSDNESFSHRPEVESPTSINSETQKKKRKKTNKKSVVENRHHLALKQKSNGTKVLTASCALDTENNADTLNENNNCSDDELHHNSPASLNAEVNHESTSVSGAEETKEDIVLFNVNEGFQSENSDIPIARKEFMSEDIDEKNFFLQEEGDECNESKSVVRNKVISGRCGLLNSGTVSNANPCNAVVKYSNLFDATMQHDSQEFLNWLLDNLHEDVNLIKTKPYVEMDDYDGSIKDEEVAKIFWDAHVKRNDSLIVDHFYGQYKSKMTCTVCRQISIKFDPFMNLTIEVPNLTVDTEVFFVRSDNSTTIKIRLNIDYDFSIRRVIQKLSANTGFPANEILFAVHKCGEYFFDYDTQKFLDSSWTQISLVSNYEFFFYHFIPNRAYIQLLHCVKNVEDSSRLIVDKNSFMSISAGTYSMSELKNVIHKNLEKHLITLEEPYMLEEILQKTMHFIDENDNIVTDDQFDLESGCITSFKVLWSSQIFDYESFITPKLIKKFNDTPSPTFVFLSDCIKKHLEVEIVDEYYCSKCKKHQKGEKKLDFWKLPSSLIIHLKRFFQFSHDSNWIKREVSVDFDLEGVSFEEFCLNKKEYQKYDLLSISNHYDTSHCKVGEKWCQFDDDEITEISNSDVINFRSRNGVHNLPFRYHTEEILFSTQCTNICTENLNVFFKFYVYLTPPLSEIMVLKKSLTKDRQDPFPFCEFQF
ncbi:hypothetical protein HK099_004102 [Clydaea vesicula]|uniref:ubiquitinyl hydrolase 1 n=1 Tax=Clydaea vesicula TaxID=447962 RepID=A0AAD5U5D8_9FUNG|nr:hypothetical protein HK099_004102 [Clydaea vesicula]